MTRWHTLAWYLVTLAVIALIVMPESNQDDGLTRPTSEDTQAAGLAAFTRWLQNTTGIEVQSHRARFAESTPLPSGRGHLLITHLPSSLLHDASEILYMNQWIERGNTLLVVTGHLEGSPWIYNGHDPTRSLWRLTGLGLYAPKREEANTDSNSLAQSIDAALSVPGWLLLHGSQSTKRLIATEQSVLSQLAHIEVPFDGATWHPVTQTSGNADTEPRHYPWQVELEACAAKAKDKLRYLLIAGECTPIPTPSLNHWQPLLVHPGSDQVALWHAPLGQGQTFALLHPSLLGNEGIHRYDNRTFAISLIEQALGSHGIVIIDDAHQGLNNIIEGSDLLADSRLWISFGFLLLFWLAYLLADSGHWQRAVYRLNPTRIGQSDMVMASANFLQLRLMPNAAYELMLAPLTKHLAKKWQLPAEHALSEGLALEEKHQPNHVKPLQAQLIDLAADRRINPVKFYRQIRQVLAS